MSDEPKRAGRPPRQTVENPTRPGFRPAARLGYLKAPKGFTARWCSADPDNIARKQAEGWILMDKKDNKGTEVRVEDVSDGTQVSSRIKYRDMVAMMLPDDIKEDRTEYYRSETRRSMDQIMKKSDAEAKQLGVQTYTPKGQAGRIVIE